MKSAAFLKKGDEILYKWGKVFQKGIIYQNRKSNEVVLAISFPNTSTKVKYLPADLGPPATSARKVKYSEIVMLLNQLTIKDEWAGYEW